MLLVPSEGTSQLDCNSHECTKNTSCMTLYEKIYTSQMACPPLIWSNACSLSAQSPHSLIPGTLMKQKALQTENSHSTIDTRALHDSRGRTEWDRVG